MAVLIRTLLCLVILLSGTFSTPLFAGEVRDGDQSLQKVTMLESFKLAKGDTLWSYWMANARTRELYRGNWGEFLNVVSRFNHIIEWRTVRPNMVVHIPLPSLYAIGFAVEGAEDETVTVVLEQSTAGQGVYRFKEVVERAAPESVPHVIKEQDMAALPQVETQILRQDAQKEIVANQLGQQLKLIRGILFLLGALVLMLGMILIVLFARGNAAQRSQREMIVFAQRLAEHERIRVNAERQLEVVVAAHEVTKKELEDVKGQFAHARQLYDHIFAETKVQMEHMAPYMYRFMVSEKWFDHPDAGKTLLVPKKTEGKRIFLKPHGAEDWMLVENVERFLRDSEQARVFYGLGDPVDREHANSA